MDEDRRNERNERRRKAYATMDVAQKDAMLKRRRTQYAVSRASAVHQAPRSLTAIGAVREIGEPSSSTSPCPIPRNDMMPSPTTHASNSGCRTSKRNRAHVRTHVYPCKRSFNAIPLTSPTNDAPPPWPDNTTSSTLPSAPDCSYCTAKRFYREPPSFCCSGGEISLASSTMPADLFRLFTSNDTESVKFQKYVRTYNNHLAFTTFATKTDADLMRNTKGIYTFSVQGKIHHFLDCLHNTSDPPRNLQLYFYDPELELDQRLLLSVRLDRALLESLLNILTVNPYVRFLRQLKDLESIDDYRICLVNTPALDQRVYNEPTSRDVCAIFAVQDQSSFMPELHVQIYAKDAMPTRISHNFACFDPLQYPLLFAHGECGWHYGIEKLPPNRSRGNRTCTSSISWSTSTVSDPEHLIAIEEEAMADGMRKRNTVSCREYCCYKLQMRSSDRSGLLHSGRLLQQYVVEMFVKLESCRLEYLKKQQQEIRTECLQGIVDSISSGNTLGSSVGRRVILPQSFMGGPRDMRKRYMDAMALVQQFGKPDIFLTMTCNPSWEEITKHLLPGELSQNRPDLLSRVFKAKLEMLKKDFLTDHAFGTPVASVYSTEFQKRGLPLVHMLLILDHASKILNPEAYDRYISAELPDQSKDADLHALVARHMIHGPLNKQSPCMRDHKCKNRYPRDFLDYTTHAEDSYPFYRRRNTGASARFRAHTVDNRWVVPYNPYLLKKYDCHINVEICSSVKLVKYLYKYIYKGPEKIAFQVSAKQPENEIQQYQKRQWVSSPKAAWRLYSFPLYEMHPAVLTLQVHLPNNYFVSFRATEELTSVATNDFLGRTMLTQFFYMNQHNEHARAAQCLYKDFPKHFVWDSGKRFWSERKKGRVVGRLVTVPPTEGERYYLRLLLNNVRAPTSFDDLLTVHGHMYPSFRESSLQRGLLATDLDLCKCLDEAVTYQMPRQLRQLFASILVFCSPSSPRQLWQKYASSLCEDYTRLQPAVNTDLSASRKSALRDLLYLLDSMGKKLQHYNLGPEAYIVCKHLNLAREIEFEKSIIIDEDDLINVTKLNPEQLRAYDTIIEKAMANEPAVFFIDGPGGTGKTFLYKTILATLRSQDHIAIATATSEVAASVLPGGRTAHSRFKLPLHNDESTATGVSRQSAVAKLLREAKVVIWDEAPMAHRKSVEAFAEMLRDITQVNRPFGDKVIVFGGDFRQVLPVVTNGSRLDQIDACLISSPLWPSFTKIQLTENMRSRYDPSFADFLLRIGNGTEPEDIDSNITLPTNMVIPFTEKDKSVNTLIAFVYPDTTVFSTNPASIVNQALLAPTNNAVDEINDRMLTKMQGEIFTYVSTDVAIDPQHQGDYEDFLNTLNPSGLPPHKLHLKINCPVILLRNLNPTEGLCNGTRLMCKELNSHTIVAQIVTGPNAGESTILHKIPLESSSEEKRSGIPFKRYQFPIRLCFAMTINKAQGQTLERVGIYLREPIFSHGQLYVALSRAKKSTAVRVLIVPPTLTESVQTNETKNIVFREIVTR